MKSEATCRISSIAVVCLLIIAFAAAPVTTQAQDPEQRTSIIVTDIDDNPVKTIGDIQPFADYLAAHLADVGIETGEVMVAPDMDTMIEWLATGQVDILFDSPYPAMVMVNEAGAVPVLRRWKDGVPAYHSVFFAMKDSGLDRLEDLEGRVVAFEAPESTSGYMLPKAYLLEMGMNPVEKSRVTSRVRSGEVGYVFSKATQTTVQWVISGRVAAGVVDSEAFARVPEDARAQMIILAETVDVPRHMMIVRPDMDPALLEAITEVLLVMHEDEEGRMVLDEYDTARFDEFPQGPEAALEALQELFDAVQ